MEIEIGWRLMSAIIVVALAVVASFKAIHGDTTTQDLREINKN